MEINDDIKNKGKYIQSDLKWINTKPNSRHNKLKSEIIKGKELKSISEAPQPPILNIAPGKPGNDVDELFPDDKFEKTISANKIKNSFKKNKENLKNNANKYRNEKKEVENNYNKANYYDNKQEEFNRNTQKIIAQENLILNGYDNIINKVGSIEGKYLSSADKKELNEMLKKIDGSNIGATTTKENALKKLNSKREKIETEKN